MQRREIHTRRIEFYIPTDANKDVDIFAVREVLDVAVEEYRKQTNIDSTHGGVIPRDAIRVSHTCNGDGTGEISVYFELVAS